MRRSPRNGERDHPAIENPANPEEHPHGQKHLPGLKLVSALPKASNLVLQIFVSPVLHLLLLSIVWSKRNVLSEYVIS
jgi:hypothetical protein